MFSSARFTNKQSFLLSLEQTKGVHKCHPVPWDESLVLLVCRYTAHVNQMNWCKCEMMTFQSLKLVGEVVVLPPNTLRCGTTHIRHQLWLSVICVLVSAWDLDAVWGSCHGSLVKLDSETWRFVIFCISFWMWKEVFGFLISAFLPSTLGCLQRTSWVWKQRLHDIVDACNKMVVLSSVLCVVS